MIATQAAAAVLMFAVAAPLAAMGRVPAGEAGPARLTEDQKAIHVLNRLGFGARPGDVAKVKAMGIRNYIEQQLDPGKISDSLAEKKVAGLEIFNMSTAEVFAKYPSGAALLRNLDAAKNRPGAAMPAAANADLSEADRKERQQRLQELYKKYDLRPAGRLQPQITANRVLRAVYSERQLQEVMVDFWQNHFNVFAGKGAVRWYIPSYERDVLRKNAMGNFRDLLVGTAKHPAMLFFLDNFESTAPQPAAPPRPLNRIQQAMRDGTFTPQMRERLKERQGITDDEIDKRIARLRNARPMPNRPARGLNENYARELMELHTMGVDSGYTQKDIVEVARAFTGWTIADPRGYRKAAAAEIMGTEDAREAKLKRSGLPDGVDSGDFYFDEKRHDKGAKTVLGQTVNEGGMADGLKVIDIIMKNPATARFIAQKLCVKFVSDTPSKALVDKAAAAFGRSGGDIKTTLRAIFEDKEFFAPQTYRAKIKTPFELAISAIRAVGADTNGGPAMQAMLRKLGELPYAYQAPTGYPDTAEDWVNTGALLERLNFAVALAGNQIPGTRVDLKRFNAATRSDVLAKAMGSILDNDVSAATKATLKKQVEQKLAPAAAPVDVDDDAEMAPGRRAPGTVKLLRPSGDPETFKVVSLVLGTPEFQRQ